jgi:hypothetical protein
MAADFFRKVLQQISGLAPQARGNATLKFFVS